MNSKILKAFYNLTNSFEGHINHFYLDIKGLVTVGMGCLVEPESECRTLTFLNTDGTIASVSDVIQSWRRVKLNQSLRNLGHKPFASIAKLIMPENEIIRLFDARTLAIENRLKEQICNWNQLHENMQLATLLICWAIGSEIKTKFPNYSRGLESLDWELCARECKIRGEESNKGLIPRNAMIKKLLTVAS